MSDTISSFLTHDHRACDEKFAELENAVSANNWDAANGLFEGFSKDLLHHFSMEEDVMFKIFQEKTGMQGGPTAIMTMEHNQMRQVLTQMKEFLDAKDQNKFFGVSESLMILIQQHNMKEEQMLYAMADAHLADQVDDVVAKMKELEK